MKFIFVYDAIFIIDKDMSQNALSKYTTYAKNSKTPFFFINFKHDDNDKTYAIGYSYADNGFESWSYNLNENIENEENIKDVYSRIFKDISKDTH